MLKPMNWYVIYTKSKQEKKVAEQLVQLGMEVYFPIMRVERQWSDRRKIVEEPLFRSYVFVRCTSNERQRAFAAFGVVRYLYWLGMPAVVREAEIQAIRDLLGEIDCRELVVEHFEPRDRVLVKSGPLMNKYGIVVSVNGNFVELLLDSLQMKIKLDKRNNKLTKWLTEPA